VERLQPIDLRADRRQVAFEALLVGRASLLLLRERRLSVFLPDLVEVVEDDRS
jgi:hypothetical protein